MKTGPFEDRGIIEHHSVYSCELLEKVKSDADKKWSHKTGSRKIFECHLPFRACGDNTRIMLSHNDSLNFYRRHRGRIVRALGLNPSDSELKSRPSFAGFISEVVHGYACTNEACSF